MKRLNEFAFDKMGLPIFNIPDVMSLLANQRDEAFEGERAIRLFQFRTWLLFPEQDEGIYPKSATFITAVKFLDRLEENYFADDEDARLRNNDDTSFLVDLTHKPDQTINRIRLLKRENSAYRQIFDQMIGRPGGLMGVLKTPPPWIFDGATDERFERIELFPT